MSPNKFQWIEGFEREIRQFDEQELVSLLDYFDCNWPGVTFATALAKTFLWSWGRRSEIATLRWGDAKIVGNESGGFERHFETVGKWAVDKWFRIPEALYEELLQVRTESPYVFAAYNRQLRQFHDSSCRPWLANRLKTEFCPKDVGDWFYNRISDWSKSLPNGSACIHVFRKTSLQYARAGEDVNRRVAADARVGAGVLMTNYVKETDEECGNGAIGPSPESWRACLPTLPSVTGIRPIPSIRCYNGSTKPSPAKIGLWQTRSPPT